MYSWPRHRVVPVRVALPRRLALMGFFGAVDYERRHGDLPQWWWSDWYARMSAANAAS
jgi:hypothetical protein